MVLRESPPPDAALGGALGALKARTAYDSLSAEAHVRLTPRSDHWLTPRVRDTTDDI